MNKATKTSVWSCPEELKEWEEARTQRIQQQKRKAQDEAAADVSTASPSDAPKPPKKKKPKTVHSLAEMQESDPELAKRLAEELKAEQEHDPSVAEMQKYEAEQKAKREKESELTSDENKAMFKALLGEKDINPMAPWDMELPKFVADPRYAGAIKSFTSKYLFSKVFSQLLSCYGNVGLCSTSSARTKSGNREASGKTSLSWMYVYISKRFRTKLTHSLSACRCIPRFTTVRDYLDASKVG